jgi:hypothetical protein
METRGVPLKTSIRVQFDRFLAPDSAVRQAICVQACSVGPTAQCDGQCLGNLLPEYDPVDRVAVWKNAMLVAGQRYNVRLLVPANDDDPTGIRAIDGTPLEAEYTFAFTAGDPSKTMPTDMDFIKPELVAAEAAVGTRESITFCSTSPYCPVPARGCTTPPPDPGSVSPQALLGSCAASSVCHSLPTPPVLPMPPNVLLRPVGSVFSLRSADAGVPGAVIRLVNEGVVATETAVGPDPSVARRSPKDVFGANMPYIDATNPGNSYAVYKMILGMAPRCGHTDEETPNPSYASTACLDTNGQLSTDEFLCSSIQCMPEAGAMRPTVDGGGPPPGVAGQPAPGIVPSWVPDDRWKPPIGGEYARLRQRIRGDGMPPPDAPGPTSFQTARALTAWIAKGASVDCSATP